MIIFNVDSMNLICNTLQKTPKQQFNTFFFNDGCQNHQVADFTTLEEYFDVHGMSQAITTGYKITFIGGGELVTKMDGESLQVMPFTCQPETKADYGISTKVSKYMF
ncbi:hypothetical protein C942_04133 [Photobacterium marinum]|uniref:Uncharacterized protein n=1 Tax=Photobacterium marinum TaxID=1056511 RepID=L8JC66_9GAMM|nr:hypothetical protein [Photobacterium marinum]ELR66435.1 hypothetical protein C942_04133 [Photobacterium marinum]